MARSAYIEIWKPVPGHGGRFIASSQGRIARITGHSGAYGYQQVFLSKREMRPFRAASTGRKQPNTVRGYAHHLVALAFLGKPPKGKTQINHKDFDRSNNCPSNLEWSSQRENVIHAWANGRMSKRGRNVTTREISRIVDLYAQGKSYSQIARLVRRCTYTVGYQVRKQKRLGVLTYG
jgi:hypothetical protein